MPKHIPTYNSWRCMLRRCTEPAFPGYSEYGGAGVTIPSDWRNYDNFVRDMGERPHGKTLDRFPDYAGSYSKDNCRWASPREQLLNQKTRRDNSSGVKGVSWQAAKKKWRTRGFGKTLYYGDSFEKAVEVRKAWEAANAAR